MSKYTSIIPGTPVSLTFGNYNLRKNLLLFDNIIFDGGSKQIDYLKTHKKVIDAFGSKISKYYFDLVSDLESLNEMELLTEYGKLLNDKENPDLELSKYRSLYEKYDSLTNITEEDLKQVQTERILESINSAITRDSLGIRAIAAFKNKNNRNEVVVPLIHPYSQEKKFSLPTAHSTTKSKMLKVVLNKLPVLSSEIPIKEIISFKNEEKSQLQFFKLIHWINTLQKSNTSQAEFDDHLNYLIAEYENNLRLHKLKYSYSSLHTFIGVTAEILENVVQFKFKNAVDAVFNIQKNELSMLSEEKDLKGSETAYIISSRQNFE